MLIVNRFGIYDTIFASRKPEVKPFKRWVYSVIDYLREQSGLEGYYTKMFMYGGVGVEGKVELIGTEGINDMKRRKRINDRAGVKHILPPSPGLITVRNHILKSKLNNKEEK